MKQKRQPATKAENAERKSTYEIVEGSEDESEGDFEAAPKEVYAQRSSGSPYFSAEKPVRLDLDSLDVDEAATVEELSKQPLETIMARGECSRRQLQAIIFVVSRREFPDITFEEAGKCKPTEYEWVYEETEEGAALPALLFTKGSPASVALTKLVAKQEKELIAEIKKTRAEASKDT